MTGSESGNAGPAVGSASPRSTVSGCSAARRPSVSVKVRLACWSLKPSSTSTGMRAVATVPPSLTSMSGLRKIIVSGPSTKMSGVLNGMSDRAVTRTRPFRKSSFTGPRSPPVTAVSILMPWAEPSPGTRERYLPIRWAWSVVSPFPAGRSKEKCGLVGDADVVAGQVVELGAELEGLGRILDPGIDGEDHFLFVAGGFEAEDREPYRRRPGKIGLLEVGGVFPVDARRIARVSRGAPINLPVVLELELQSQLHGFLAVDGGLGGNQPHPGLFRGGPGRRGGGPRRRPALAPGRRQNPRHCRRAAHR